MIWWLLILPLIGFALIYLGCLIYPLEEEWVEPDWREPDECRYDGSECVGCEEHGCIHHTDICNRNGEGWCDMWINSIRNPG